MSDQIATCAFHPDTETRLHCNRCEKPICAKCAVQTPVGYRCRDCVKGQQAHFETVRALDYFIAAAISAVGVGLATWVLRFLSYWGLFLAPVVGGGLAEIVRLAVGRRRGRRLPMAAAIAGGLGVLPHLVLPLLGIIMGLVAGAGLEYFAGVPFTILWPLVDGFLIISTLFYRLRGIRL